MILQERNIFFYLLEYNLVNPNDFLAGNFVIDRLKGRNLCYGVRAGTDSLLLKQPNHLTAAALLLSQNEGSFYNWVSQLETKISTVPFFIHYDKNEHILCLKYIEHTINLEDYFRSHDFGPVEIANSLGADLKETHQVLAHSILTLSIDKLQNTIPWPFFLGEPNGPYRPRNEVERIIITRIQNLPTLRERLTVLRDAWLPYGIIHGDLKPKNILVNTEVTTRVKFVDWENIQIGDQAWDLAGLIQGYWCTYFYLGNEKNELSFDHVRLNVQSLLETYTDDSSTKSLSPFSIKSLHYAGVRLFQSLLEASPGKNSVGLASMKLFQLAFNLIHSTEEDLYAFVYDKHPSFVPSATNH